MSVSGSLHQDPVESLALHLWPQISAAGSFRSTCIRTLWDPYGAGFLHQNPVESLVLHLCPWISAAGSFRSTCIRILWDLRGRTFVARSPQCVFGFAHTVCNFQLGSCWFVLRIPGKYAFGIFRANSSAQIPTQRSCTKSFRRILTQRILTQGSWHRDLAHPAGSLRTTSADLRPGKSKNCTHPARLTRTMVAECSHVENMFRKHCARHKTVARGHTKCRSGHAKIKFKFQKRNHSQKLNPATSKHSTHGADSSPRPHETQSFKWLTPAYILAQSAEHCACHGFCHGLWLNVRGHSINRLTHPLMWDELGRQNGHGHCTSSHQGSPQTKFTDYHAYRNRPNPFPKTRPKRVALPLWLDNDGPWSAWYGKVVHERCLLNLCRGGCSGTTFVQPMLWLSKRGRTYLVELLWQKFKMFTLKSYGANVYFHNM